MKLYEALNQGDIMVYYYEYDHNSRGGSEWHSERSDETYQDAIAEAKDNIGAEGSEVAPGVWVGYSFTEPEIDDDEDEDGPYQYTNIGADVVIVAAQHLPPNHSLFSNVIAETRKQAEQLLGDALEAHNDDAEYNRDPLGYYGMKQSDFM